MYRINQTLVFSQPVETTHHRRTHGRSHVPAAHQFRNGKRPADDVPGRGGPEPRATPVRLRGNAPIADRIDSTVGPARPSRTPLHGRHALAAAAENPRAAVRRPDSERSHIGSEPAHARAIRGRRRQQQQQYGRFEQHGHGYIMERRRVFLYFLILRGEFSMILIISVK